MYVLRVGFRESGFQTVVARASRPCVGRAIRTGGTLRDARATTLAQRPQQFRLPGHVPHV